MATARSQKAKEPAYTTSSTPDTRSPAPAMLPTPPTTNGKKNKKKKGKGKEPAVQSATQRLAGVGAQDGDFCYDMPSLEDPDLPRPPRTGLSPMLESVHITTTGYLSASAAAIARSGTSVTTQVHSELLATAHDLHRRNIGVQSNGRASAKAPQPIPQSPLPKMNGTNASGIADDEYWSSFPPHIKNFVSHTESAWRIIADGSIQGTNHV
jgi:hypothetical protein